MAKHKTFFGKLFGWIGDLFHGANKDFLNIAVNVTQKIKDALSSRLTDFITSLIPGDLDNKIVELLRAKIPLLLADELLIQGVQPDATAADIQALEQKILDSFGGLSDEKKEKFFTTIAAEIYIFIVKHKDGHKVTFGEAASLVEAAYRAYLNLKEDQSNG